MFHIAIQNFPQAIYGSFTLIVDVSPNVATLICGQVSPLKLRLTFLSVRVDNFPDSAAETTNVGASIPAALAFVENTWSLEALGSIDKILLSVSIQYVTFIDAA
jgi:hypothetical protein